MQFIVVRLGKDSIEDIKKITFTKPQEFTPYTLSFTCKQVEQSIEAGAYVLIYLGSDNNKGIPTDWKQGLRALGKLEAIEGWENFQSTCTLKIKVLSIFPESLDQFSFLEKSAQLYANFSQYPIIGVKSSRNNSVQKVHEGERERSEAVFTAIASIYSDFKKDVAKNASELSSMLSFKPTNADAAAISDIPKIKKGAGSNKKGENLIFYGAPGTGKSYAIDKSIEHENAIKTVFHAETMNSDFLGGIKPVAEINEKKEKALTYKYLPGPFLRAFIQAIKYPEKHFWLVIEEINRAPAATVFGEVFQLLDRDKTGESSYKIDVPDPLCAQYLSEQLGEEITKIFIPENLSLIASMNSSDQGVMPLDTAFKRRWQFVYIPLDFEKSCPSGKLKIILEENETAELAWQDFAVITNKVLSDASVPEDRHLGPYFLNDEDLKNSDQALTGKLFMYLWDDVLRHGQRSRLFDANIKTYGQLITSWSNKSKIFSDLFISLAKDRVAASAPKA